MKLIQRAFLALLVLALTAAASQADFLFEKGNRFYEDKNFDSAVVCYEQSEDCGISSSILYYNLANSYFRQNRIGNAILYYERALQINPTDPDILANLNYARMNIVDRIPEPERSIVESILHYLHTLLPLTHRLITLLILLFFAVIFFALALFVKGNLRLWMTYLVVLDFLIIIPLSISSGISVYSLENKKYAVITETKIEAMNEPDGGKTLFLLHEGTKVQVLKVARDWSFIALSNGVSGWIKTASIEKI